jgi:hypothetical protein
MSMTGFMTGFELMTGFFPVNLLCVRARGTITGKSRHNPSYRQTRHALPEGGR